MFVPLYLCTDPDSVYIPLHVSLDQDPVHICTCTSILRPRPCVPTTVSIRGSRPCLCTYLSMWTLSAYVPVHLDVDQDPVHVCTTHYMYMWTRSPFVYYHNMSMWTRIPSVYPTGSHILPCVYMDQDPTRVQTTRCICGPNPCPRVHLYWNVNQVLVCMCTTCERC